MFSLMYKKLLPVTNVPPVTVGPQMSSTIFEITVQCTPSYPFDPINWISPLLDPSGTIGRTLLCFPTAPLSPSSI